MVLNTLPTIWHTYVKLVTPNIRFLPSIVAEKNVTKNILEGRTDRGKTVYPPPPSGSGGIIRSKIGISEVPLGFQKIIITFQTSQVCGFLRFNNEIEYTP
jgi:hypothetical protein